jgi:thioredoxin reductase (NADPH)
MAFKKGHLVFNQAGALPPAALDDLIAQVRAFDVDNAIGEQSSDRSDL